MCFTTRAIFLCLCMLVCKGRLHALTMKVTAYIYTEAQTVTSAETSLPYKVNVYMYIRWDYLCVVIYCFRLDTVFRWKKNVMYDFEQT